MKIPSDQKLASTSARKHHGKGEFAKAPLLTRCCLMLNLTCNGQGVWLDAEHQVRITPCPFKPLAKNTWMVEHPLGNNFSDEITTLDEAIWIAAAAVMLKWAENAFEKQQPEARAKLLVFQASAETARRDADNLAATIHRFVKKCLQLQKQKPALPPLEQFQQLVNSDVEISFTAKKGNDAKRKT